MASSASTPRSARAASLCDARTAVKIKDLQPSPRYNGIIISAMDRTSHATRACQQEQCHGPEHFELEGKYCVAARHATRRSLLRCTGQREVWSAQSARTARWCHARHARTGGAPQNSRRSSSITSSHTIDRSFAWSALQMAARRRTQSGTSARTRAVVDAWVLANSTGSN